MDHMFDVDFLLSKAFNCELLDVRSIAFICQRAKYHFLEEQNVKPIKSPVSIVGDIHGQFYDLVEMLHVGGSIPNTNYLFLGDYVDRGTHSVETITLLLLLKIRYPGRVTMLRGNHESRQITQVYGFYAECERKFGDYEVWTLFTDLFDYLPICAIVDGTYLAVHGGLSPSMQHIDQLSSLDRIGEIPHEGPLVDIMWSDPSEDRLGFTVSPRGAGYLFGQDIVETFCHVNGLSKIIRAHQLCSEGYQIGLAERVVTIWSAPNYLFRFQNRAACMEVYEDGSFFFNQYNAAPESLRFKSKPAVKSISHASKTKQLPIIAAAPSQVVRVDQPGQNANSNERRTVMRPIQPSAVVAGLTKCKASDGVWTLKTDQEAAQPKNVARLRPAKKTRHPGYPVSKRGAEDGCFQRFVKGIDNHLSAQMEPSSPLELMKLAYPKRLGELSLKSLSEVKLDVIKVTKCRTEAPTFEVPSCAYFSVNEETPFVFEDVSSFSPLLVIKDSKLERDRSDKYDEATKEQGSIPIVSRGSIEQDEEHRLHDHNLLLVMGSDDNISEGQSTPCVNLPPVYPFKAIDLYFV